jgi:restriction endonuclease S subunit
MRGSLTSPRSNTCSNMGWRTFLHSPYGDVYFSRDWTTNWNMNESVFTLRPNYGKITSEYLYMLLSSTEMKTFTKNLSAGSIHKGIRHSALKTFRLPFGNLRLSEEFSKIVRPTLKQRRARNLLDMVLLEYYNSRQTSFAPFP